MAIKRTVKPFRSANTQRLATDPSPNLSTAYLLAFSYMCPASSCLGVPHALLPLPRARSVPKSHLRCRPSKKSQFHSIPQCHPPELPQGACPNRAIHACDTSTVDKATCHHPRSHSLWGLSSSVTDGERARRPGEDALESRSSWRSRGQVAVCGLRDSSQPSLRLPCFPGADPKGSPRRPPCTKLRREPTCNSRCARPWPCRRCRALRLAQAAPVAGSLHYTSFYTYNRRCVNCI